MNDEQVLSKDQVPDEQHWAILDFVLVGAGSLYSYPTTQYYVFMNKDELANEVARREKEKDGNDYVILKVKKIHAETKIINIE